MSGIWTERDLLNQLGDARRITIIGPPGSGKSTLAHQLGQRLDLPVHHLDRLFWWPGWVMAPRHEYIAEVERLIAEARWIIDGNYTSTLPQRLERADAVIFLQPNRWKSLYRVVLRTLKHHGQTRPDMPENCPERFSWEFLRYVWQWSEDEMPETVAHLQGFVGRLIALDT